LDDYHEDEDYPVPDEVPAQQEMPRAPEDHYFDSQADDFFQPQPFYPDNPEESAMPEQRGGGMRFLIDLLETILLAVILFLIINAVSARIRVDGYSMEPTLHTGEFIIVNKLAYQFGEQSRGDIVVFHYPKNPSDEYIKRVIGVAGDEINVRSGTVMVNGQVLDEDYINAAPAYTGSWVVPDGSIFVLGDNRNNSSDSHQWGFLPDEYVIGKAIFIYWPPTEWGAIDPIDSAQAAP
jgi:signal peptidase I